MQEKSIEWVSGMGRVKYLKPVYQAWMAYGYEDVACSTYKSNLDFYHPYAISKIGAIVNYGSDSCPEVSTQGN